MPAQALSFTTVRPDKAWLNDFTCDSIAIATAHSAF